MHVQPNARTSAFAGIHGDALKVRVAAPPAGERANQALLELLERSLGIARGALRILHGRTSRRKIVEIAADPGRMAERLRTLERDLP